ncbi:MAG: hypothetical protein RIR70_1477, partial [Pseudomonadota bacterium]
APSADAARHSDALCQHIRADIVAQGGWISFARYMALALYAPGLGYYAAGAQKFGAAGDFITAPELSPLFARTLARQVAQIMAGSAPCIIEAGAGSGVLAVEMLLALEALGALPERYEILELSAELIARQRDLITQRAGHLAHRVHWLDALPQKFSGVVIGNEVLDAMPAERVCWRDEAIFCVGVALEGERLAWAERPAESALLQAAQALSPQLPKPYQSEINLAASAWVRGWGERIERGALLLIDYGFPAAEFYHPERNQGTLMCHYRHHALDDAFFYPGLTDITTHVDFTAIAQAAVDSGMEVLGYTSQANFLMNCGVLEVMNDGATDDPKTRARQSHAANMLLSPAEMGELFKVIAVGRGVIAPLMGFSRGDRVHRL